MTVMWETLDYNVGGVRTVVKAIGEGHPVLCLHGASTLEGFDYAKGLADRYRMLVPSHPGMGHSGPAPHIADMTDMLLHYLDLQDAMDLPQAPHLLGFSMGGWMATELAGLARERFDRVVLVAPAGLNDPAHPATPLENLGPQDFPGYMTHDPAIAGRYFPDGSDPSFAEAFGADRLREGDVVARLCANFGMGHPNLRRFMARISNPTLLVWGTQDRLLPASQASIWLENLPNAQFLAVPDAGHLVLQERPETLNSIGDFLAG